MPKLTRPTALLGGLTLLAAGLLASASAASADATGGTTTLTITGAYAGSAATAGVVAAATDGASNSYNTGSGSVSFSFPVTGGDANVNNFTGSLQHQGSLVLVDYKTARSVRITDLQLDFIDNTVTGRLPGQTASTPLFDLDGSGSSSSTATAQSFSATALDWDSAGAAAVDQALRTSFVVAGATVGSFQTSYTLSS